WESDGTAEGSYGLLSTADAGWFTIGPLVAFHDSLLFSTFELENGVAVWVVTPHTGEVRRVLANPLRLNR
ncbi:MAG: hypothetical protein KDE51_27425, partial [Anaerolineales bacterium]|nr:hypothetical protein [Anaerolineales bacterium]